MKKRLYISNDEAGFFDNNKMLCLDNPPTQGDFIVGDIVISNRQENGVFGWVCVLAGSPGRWEVICDLRLIQEAVEKLEQRQETIVNGDLTTIKKQITQMAAQALILDKEHKDELSKINEKVSANTNNILNINTEINTIKQTAGNLQGSIDQVVTGINAQVQTNKNNIQINSDRIAVLEGKQVNNEKEIQDIKIVNDQQTADIKGACDKILKIEQDIVKIEQAGGEIGELATQVATNTENIAKLNQLDVEIDDINKKIEDIEKSVEDTNTRVSNIELAVDNNNVEIENMKKGLASALVSNGVNADIGMSWKDLFTLLLNNASIPDGSVNPIIPGEKLLYRNGVVNDGTEFNDISIESSYLLDEYIDLNISQNGAILWFSYDGKIDFSKYENAIIEINNVAEHASLIGIGRFDTAGYGYEEGISEFNKTFVKGKEEIVIEEGSKVVHTLSFADLYTEDDKEGYFGIYIRRVAGTGGSINDAILINSITVIPKPLVPCTGLSLDKTEISLIVGGQPTTLVANVLPADCTDEVVWRSTNTAVATVDSNGVVTPKAVGTCVVRATCGELTVGVSVVVKSNIKECTSIRFTESSLKIHIDQVTDLKEILVIQPDGCTDPVEWAADNTILEINNGVIKGLAEGSTKVQARCGDLSANITITVVPKTTEDLGEGILLYKAGTQYNDTEFRNLCLPNAENSLTSNAICYALHDYSHVWFSYDGYINFNDYDRIEITAYTENSQQQPMIGLGITSVSGQQGYQNSSEWEGTPHGNVVLMYNVTETKYTIPINYTGPGYLLLWMHRNNSGLGRVYITEIRVIPKKTDEPIEIIDDEITIQVGERYDATKLYALQEGYNVQYKYSSILAIEGEHTIVGKEVGTTELEIICGGIIKTVTINVVNPTGGMVLFDNGEHFSTEFGNVVYPTNYVSHVGDIDFNLTTNYCTYAAICYDGHINFNNYDAVAITVHTENTQQTNTQIMVGRGLDPVYMVAAGTPPYTMSYEESTFSTMTNTKTQATYTFSFDALRQQDDDTGYLGIRILRGDADGHVYIDKIVVYRDGEYNSGGTVEPR